MQLLLREPWETIGYVSYAETFALSRSRIARAIARRSRLALDTGASALNEWKTCDGGGFIATGIGGQLTGRAVSKLLVFDDPHKNRQEAESPVSRDHVFDEFSGAALTRSHPGTSILVVHTRWHEDDLIGRLSKLLLEDGTPSYEVINLPAINGVGEALWPTQRPLSFLNRLRKGGGLSDYDWESMYMGRPRPRGAEIFRGVTYYNALPATYRIGKGLDLAYTQKSRADHSVGLALLQAEDQRFYVAHVERRQLELDKLIPHLTAQTRVFPGTYRFYASSTEKGIAQISRLLPPDTIRIHADIAMSDKFTHSQRSATEWNAGRILVPDEQAQAQLRALGLSTDWVKPFVEEMQRFTGVSDREDDRCDALFNAVDTFPVKHKPPVTGGGFNPGVALDDISGGYG